MITIAIDILNNILILFSALIPNFIQFRILCCFTFVSGLNILSSPALIAPTFMAYDFKGLLNYNGIAAGIIFYPIMKVFTGRHKEVHPIIYVLAALFIVRFVLFPQ